jgi:hypothetical protein
MARIFPPTFDMAISFPAMVNVIRPRAGSAQVQLFFSVRVVADGESGLAATDDDCVDISPHVGLLHSSGGDERRRQQSSEGGWPPPHKEIHWAWLNLC